MSKRAGRSRELATPRPEDTDDNVVLDAQADDWAGRRRLRANPTTARLYRGAVAVLGLVIVVAGLIAVPAPGPGWLIVFVGVSVWASEFEWAQRLLRWGRARLHRWNTWMLQLPTRSSPSWSCCRECPRAETCRLPQPRAVRLSSGPRFHRIRTCSSVG